MRRLGLAAALLPLLIAAPAAAQDGQCFGQLDADSVEARPGPALRFGVTPGVQTGQLGSGPAPPRTPEDPARQLEALAALRPGGGPFVLRLHRFFWSDGEEGVRRFLELADRYTRAGYLVELQLRYHPDERQEGDLAAWRAYVRDVVARFGRNPRVVAVQVTNEVNLTFSPDSSDGAYDGARDALIEGVKAAKDEVRRRGYRQLEIGFNWAYRSTPQEESAFWGYLRDHGGPSFVRSLDWVGVDAYPGTLFPPANTQGGERDSMVNAFSAFRCYAATAGIPESVPIHVEENGWPTDPPARSYERQAEVADTLVRAVHEFRGTFNVTDYRWFNLRDGDSTSANFQTQYGLMTDEYVPKPAFGAYRSLVGELSRGYAAPRLSLSVRCRAGRWRARVGGAGAAEVVRAGFRVGARRAGPDLRAPFEGSISARRVRPGRTRWTMVARASLLDGRVVALSRAVGRCRAG
ncbi:MAG TPA: hypothetical protein VF520_05055 [Thermoleophilaceae bacterium]|jgi:hypothetical protein